MDDLWGGAAVLPIDDVLSDAVAPAAERNGPLTARAMERLREFFDAADHHPSGEHWAALAAIAGTMEDMANGRCEPRVFLSSLDCGAGKTQPSSTLLGHSRRHQSIGTSG